MQTANPVELAKEPVTLPREGEVYSYTIVQDPPESFQAQSPYVLALVKLDGGPVVTAQITDLSQDDKLQIGDRVEMVTRKLTTEGSKGMIVYGYKFRKVLASSS
jgi:uncharacterized protein